MAHPTSFDHAQVKRAYQAIDANLMQIGFQSKDPSFATMRKNYMYAVSCCVTIINSPNLRTWYHGYTWSREQVVNGLRAKSVDHSSPLPQPMEAAIALVIDFADPVAPNLIELCIELAADANAKYQIKRQAKIANSSV